MINPTFTWPAELYDSLLGLTRATLESVTARDRLWEHAAEYANWPTGLQGRIEFHALCLYALRTGRSPGRLITDAVRGSKHGRNGWTSSQDRMEAARLIGQSAYYDARLKAVIQRVQPANAPPRDWSEIDSQIEHLTDDELIDLLSTQFDRDAFTRAADAGKCARRIPTIRHALRRSLESRQRLEAAAQ